MKIHASIVCSAGPFPTLVRWGLLFHNFLQRVQDPSSRHSRLQRYALQTLSLHIHGNWRKFKYSTCAFHRHIYLNSCMTSLRIGNIVAYTYIMFVLSTGISTSLYWMFNDVIPYSRNPQRQHIDYSVGRCSGKPSVSFGTITSNSSSICTGRSWRITHIAVRYTNEGDVITWKNRIS